MKRQPGSSKLKLIRIRSGWYKSADGMFEIERGDPDEQPSWAGEWQLRAYEEWIETVPAKADAVALAEKILADPVRMEFIRSRYGNR